MNIIGISGKKRAGKDTIADYLCKNHKYTRMAFADSLKEAVGIMFGFTHDQMYSDLKEKEDKFWKVKPREILQIFGTELMRTGLQEAYRQKYGYTMWWGEDFWVQVLKRKYKELQLKAIQDDTEVPNIVISDLRFNNEANMIKELGGYLIRVERPSTDDFNDMHPSEIGLDRYNTWDKTIINDGDIDALNQKVNIALSDLKQRSIIE